MTLPSNSSQEFFPDNTLTEFITKLPSTIELTGEWEVGLAEMMFPRSWYTIPKGGLTIFADYRRCDVDWILDARRRVTAEGEVFEENTVVKIMINEGFYNSMDELGDEFNYAAMRAFSRVSALIEPPEFYYKTSSRRMLITMPPGMSLEFPPSLESILGLTSRQNPICNSSLNKLTIKGDLSCDLQTGIHALYVYCDILQFTSVGNIKAPLLRAVDSGGEAGDVVTRYYEKPRYIPIQKKTFDTIQIVIRDDLGEKILFENGKVLLTLHFRRTRNQYLI